MRVSLSGVSDGAEFKATFTLTIINIATDMSVAAFVY